MTSLGSALKVFESTEANLVKLEKLWGQLMENAPLGGDPRQYEELMLAFGQVCRAMPAIDGYVLRNTVYPYDAVAQMRIDANEIGDVDALMGFEGVIREQEKLLQEYRFKLHSKRRQLVRERVLQLIGEVDDQLVALLPKSESASPHESMQSAAWDALKQHVAEIDTLLGSAPRPNRWRDLQRHLHFGMAQDLHDIESLDWPAIKAQVTQSLYGEHDPVPVAVADLGDVVAKHPTGPVPTKLQWSVLSDEDFERLIFVLIAGTPGYENPRWLQATHAPDKGRDLSVDRIEDDLLLGVRRERTIVQCKHWLSRSINVEDVTTLRSQMELWQPPRVDSLVIATSGRFTADAVDLIERHNQTDRALRIAMWPESHLELLLASRPNLIAEFGLRT